MVERVEIYTDGACSGNPGPGGWGALMLYKGNEKEIYGGEPETTNNRMEMLAAINALKALTRKSPVRIHTDSKYLKDGITQWIKKWRTNGWRTAARKPVKNADLWQELESMLIEHDVEWAWVKGHSGHPENERADALANQGMAPYKSSF